LRTPRKWIPQLVFTVALAAIAIPATPAFASPRPAHGAAFHPRTETAPDLSWTSPVVANSSASSFGWPNAVACPSTTLCVAVGAGAPFGHDVIPNVIVSSDPTAGTGSWSPYNLPAAEDPENTPLVSVSCPTTSFCAAVDWDKIVTSTDPTGGASAWTVTSAPVDWLTSISCPSANLCVVGTDGDDQGLLTSTDPTGGTSAWTFSSMYGDYFTSMSCPSVNLCVALVSSGVWTSSDPAGGASTWTATVSDLGSPTGDFSELSCPTTMFCAAVDTHGNAVTSTNPVDPAAWSALENIDPPDSQLGGLVPQLLSISCPSATFCMAADDLGNVVYSTNPAGGAGDWTASDLNSVLDSAEQAHSWLTALDCLSATSCIGLDQSGDEATSTDPTGGPTSWTVTTSPLVPYAMEGISCPTTSLCVAVDGVSENTGSPGAVVVSTDPAAAGSWIVVPGALPSSSSAISCPSTTLCVVVDQAGDIVTSTDPTGGAAAWVAVPAVDPNKFGFTAISCPTVTLCVATDGTGDILTSTDPTGGASAWSAPEHVIGVAEFDSISCATASMCLAAGVGGHNEGDGEPDGLLATSSDPTAGAPAWSVTDVAPGAGPMTSATCPSATMCLALNQWYVYESNDPSGGLDAWSFSAPGSGTDFNTLLDALTCPSTSFCVVADVDGDVATTDEPAISGYPWTFTAAVDENGDTWEFEITPFSCPTTNLCVAVDNNGDFIAGTPTPVAVTEDPTSLATAAGDTATFTAAAAGGSSVPVQWQVTRNGGLTYHNVPGGTSSTLKLKAVALESGDRYRAKFRGPARQGLTASATLTVKPSELPSVRSNPTGTLKVGTPGTVVLMAIGVPTPVLNETGALPKGVTLMNIGDGYALISGTPGRHRAGTYWITVTAVNAVGSSSQKFELTVDKA
jgi:hypothetical protein